MVKKQDTITVSGVTFSADQVKTATVKIDGRVITIGEQENKPQRKNSTRLPYWVVRIIAFPIMKIARLLQIRRWAQRGSAA